MSYNLHRFRRKPKRKRLTSPGAPPGMLIVPTDALPPEIQCIAYGPDNCTQTDVATADQLPPLRAGETVRWINVDNFGDVETIRKLGDAFGLHPLEMEDIVDAHQRPKIDVYENHILIITRVPVDTSSEDQGDTTYERLQTRQVAICLGRDFVITFQEKAGSTFDPVKRRLNAVDSRFRTRGPDYLAYTLIDAAIDAFFPLLEAYGEQVEDVELQVVEQPQAGQINRIHGLKRNLLTARRTIWPQREMLNTLVRDESLFISARTQIYLRDCYDHTIQLIDMIETYREITSGLVDIHLSSTSNRMNEVMKLLTIISTVFIPLTFIVGVYGMNFDPEVSQWNMPELAWQYGYPGVMLVMTSIAAGLVWLFRRRGWIGKQND